MIRGELFQDENEGVAGFLGMQEGGVDFFINEGKVNIKGLPL